MTANAVALILLLLAMASPARAENVLNPEDEQLLLQNFSSELFSAVENERIRSILIRVGARQQRYHLVFKSGLNELDKASMTGVDLKYSLLPSGQLSLEAFLYNIGNGKKVKRVSKDRFERPLLYQTTELALEALFNLLPPEKVPPPPKRKKKKKIKPARKNQGRNFESAALPFRKRILGIKNDLAVEYKKLEEKEDTISQSGQGDAKKEESAASARAASSAPLAAALDEERPRKSSKEKNPWSKSYALYGGLDFQSYDLTDRKGSVAEVDIQGNIVYLMAGIEARAKHSGFPWASFFIGGHALNPVVEDDQVESSPAINFSLGSRFYAKKIRSVFTAALKRETLNLALRPKIGEGLQLGKFNLTWLALRLAYDEGGKWQAFLESRSMLSAQEGNEHADAQGFQASSFGLGGSFKTDFIMKATEAVSEVRFLSFSNSAVFPLEGEGLQFRFYMTWRP